MRTALEASSLPSAMSDTERLADRLASAVGADI